MTNKQLDSGDSSQSHNYSQEEDKNENKENDNKNKGDAFNSNRNSGMRGTTKSDITNHTENIKSVKNALFLEKQNHMNNYIKVEEFKAKNPLDYRYRMIESLKAIKEDKKKVEQNSSESDDKPSKPRSMNISDKMKGDKEDENDEVVHFEPTLWEPNKSRYLCLEDCLDYYIEPEILNDK